MGFIEVLPQYQKSGEIINDKVIVSFKSASGKPTMTMTIGNLVAKKFGIKKSERFAILVDEDNQFLWQIRKSAMGFSVAEVGKHFQIKGMWRQKVPKNPDIRRFCKWEPVDGHLQISFCQDEIED